MNTSSRFRPSEILVLLAHAGFRRIGAAIGFVLVVLWLWAAVTGNGPGDRFMYRGKHGSFGVSSHSSSHHSLR